MAGKDSSAAEASGSVEQAMNRVLQAEREAEQAIADCEQEARQILQAAQQTAKHITDRTDQRITMIQMRLAQKIKAHIDALERADRQTQLEPSRYDLSAGQLDSVVQKVAAELTGNRSFPDNPGQKSSSE